MPIKELDRDFVTTCVRTFVKICASVRWLTHTHSLRSLIPLVVMGRQSVTWVASSPNAASKAYLRSPPRLCRSTSLLSPSASSTRIVCTTQQHRQSPQEAYLESTSCLRMGLGNGSSRARKPFLEMLRTCWRLEPFDSRIWNPTAALDKIIFQAQAAKRVEERSWRRRRILQTVQWHRRTYLPQFWQNRRSRRFATDSTTNGLQIPECR